MKNLSLLLLAALFLSYGCQDDDDVPPVTLIGRATGWSVDAVESDFATQAASAIAALTEDDLASDTRTRDLIEQQYDILIANQTQLDDCERDDAVLFGSNGIIQLFLGDVDCNQPGTHVMDELVNNFYSADIEGTRLRLRTQDGETITTYDILELTDSAFRLKNNRVVEDSTVGPVLYEVTYALRAR
ncbi:MAG: hypothetical protein AAFZ52_10355 [Bacteroidota bacterium]